jgi:SNF2 family DNA or RNA helicase
MVRPYFLRRTKESIESLLPNKADLVIWLKLTPYQVEITLMKKLHSVISIIYSSFLVYADIII